MPGKSPPGHVRVGQVVGVFGVKGMLKVQPMTDFPARFAKGAVLYCDGEAHTVVDAHWHDGQVRVMFEDVGSVEEAEAFKWAYLSVPSSDRPELGADEYVAADLIGLEVFEGPVLIGVVDDVVHSPAHDLLSVSGVLVPCVKQFVKRVDLSARRIEVELIEGMRPGDAD